MRGLHTFLDCEQKKQIAARIVEHLNRTGTSRKQLVRPDLGLHTINKALIGNFTESTLIKLEAVLGQGFRMPTQLAVDAPEYMGGYSFRTAEPHIGRYLFLRPLFSSSETILAFIIELKWSKASNCLCFYERSRPDEKHRQDGYVCLPFGKSFLYLMTLSGGSVRTVMLHTPDGFGIARGLITTLHNPKAHYYTPTTAPVVLKRLSEEEPVLGCITKDHGCYKEYACLLASVLDDEYAKLVHGPRVPDNLLDGSWGREVSPGLPPLNGGAVAPFIVTNGSSNAESVSSVSPLR